MARNTNEYLPTTICLMDGHTAHTFLDFVCKNWTDISLKHTKQFANFNVTINTNLHKHTKTWEAYLEFNITLDK
jgi:hypothetical protein